MDSTEPPDHSLWWIINKFRKVPSAVYFDDFPMFAPQVWEAVDSAVSALLNLLGWDHTVTGEGSKGKPFALSFQVLGMLLDLTRVGNGEVQLSNKEGRLTERIQALGTTDGGTRREKQELHGLMDGLPPDLSAISRGQPRINLPPEDVGSKNPRPPWKSTAKDNPLGRVHGPLPHLHGWSLERG